jgi:hypothetical protein
MLEFFTAVSCFLNVHFPAAGKTGYVQENDINVDFKEVG